MQLAKEQGCAEFAYDKLRFRFHTTQEVEVDLPLHPTVTKVEQKPENPYRKLLGELPVWKPQE